MRKGLGLLLAPQKMSSMVVAAQKAEAAGFEMVWNSELFRSIFLPLAAAAAQTQTISLVAGIALAFVRSPLITALSALDLDDLSQGRLILGLGPGVRRLNEAWHNAPYGAPAPHLRECVEVTRLIMENAHRGEPIVYAGSYYNINIRGYKRPFAPIRPTIPIYLAGAGPIMCQVAGQVADGWLGHMLGSPRWFQEHIQPNVLRGLKERGRDPSRFRFLPVLTCAVGADGRQAKRVVAATVAFYASVRTYTEFFAFHGFQKEAVTAQEAFHRGDLKGAVDAVPDAMVDAVAAAGTKDEVRRKMEQYVELTGTVTLAAPPYFVSLDQADHLQSKLIEEFGQ